MLATSGLAPRAPFDPNYARFNRNVHGARGLFAFAVFVFHVVNSGLSTLPPLSTPIGFFLSSAAEYGVELFFCISGYVIAGTLRRAESPASFFEDRAIRIFPVLWVTILTITALGLATRTHGFGDETLAHLALEVPINLLALPGILPLDNLHPAAWSLSYEMAFYLFCTACWALRRRVGRVATWWIAVPAAAILIVYYPRGVFLLTGMLVAEGWTRNTTLLRLARHPLPLILLFLLCWRTIRAMSDPDRIISTNMLEWSSDLRLPLGLLSFAVAALGFTGIVAGYGGFGRVLRSRPLQYLGTISYSFYLWHPIVMSGMKTVLLHFGVLQAVGIWAQLMFFVAALPPALAVSDISQRLLERRLAVWLRRRLHHPPPMQQVALDPPPPHSLECA